MNRAFISLYFFIVASVVLIGWGLNQFWETLAPEQEASAEVHALFNLVERDLLVHQTQTSYQPISQQQVQQLSADLQLTLEILALDDVAQSEAMRELHAGKILSASGDGNIIWYKRLADTHQVLMLVVPQTDDRESPWYDVLLIVFYLGIALAIYLWVWPLSRDSKKLEVQTRTMGKDGVPQTLDISPTSTLYPLALAFNQMAQRLRELITSHREMTNAVSHELRTPLARMKFALAMIDEEKLSDKDHRQLRSLEQDIAEMESLISSLLMYAGFEQKTQRLHQTAGYMGDLLDEIQLRFSRHNERNLQLTVNDASNNAVVYCEWKLIETVLQNLINNARRYAQTHIAVEIRHTESEYIIAVEDDGPGIPADKRERVFESFVRLYHEDESASEKSNGSATGGFGLGLAIVKRIMQWHKGKAEFVEPQQLGGARAQVRWPK
ncbi:ATP-binding protein [Cellvibrio mixtus]|uniref:ATP-binding protein n=1 Tax=Cellvibrio mixtus TaxID=39650 RepID=UPI0005871F65|nr:ATP-binding protein [Cellvibrio mixtus]